jgi:hypothetical protein
MPLTRDDFGTNPNAGASRNNAAARGWGPGWPNCNGSRMAVARGGGAAVSVRAELVPLVSVLLAATAEMGYQLKPAATGAFACRPIRGTRTPSNHCLGADTMVTTFDGPARIGDLAGTTARLLTRSPSGSGGGRWVDAPVRSYGVERVATVRMVRGADSREIVASLPHRWFVRVPSKDGSTEVVERTTAELAPGDRLASCFPARLARLQPSPFGVCHGIVYGDGTRQPGQGTKVTLWNGKAALASRFPAGCPTSFRERESGCAGVEIRSLPPEYKDRPSLDAPAHYLAGWLAGYVATDGHVRAGEIRLSSRDLDGLQFVSVVAARLGIACATPRVQKQSGGYLPGDQWSMALIAETVPDWLLIRPEHVEAFDFDRRARRSAEWRVADVVDVGAEAEVFCATVEGTGAFVLDGWLLTGNSWGLAIDINWNDNPMASFFKTDIPPRVVAMWEACGWYWGGRYMNRPDTMHFEYIYRPSDVGAHVARARGYLRSGPNPAPSPAPGTSQWEKPVNARPGSRILDRWTVGPDVALLQRFLGIKADGYYGADTIAAVRRYQKMRGLDVDGVAGPKTFAPILADLGLTA